MERLSRHEVASLSTYLGILRRRAWVIVLCAVVAPLVAYQLSSRQTAQYSSSADVYVNQQNIASALTGISVYDFSSDALAVDTQARLADVPAVAQRALQIAKVHDRAPGDLLGQTTITPDETTNILTFTVVDSSSRLAGVLATAFAKAFSSYSNGLQSQPIVRAKRELESTMAQLDAQGRKSSSLYESLQEKDQQLQTLQTLQTSGTVVVRAAGNGGKISPHPRRDGALGLVLGLMLGLGLAFGMEALDTRVRSTGELADGLGGLPLLARLPPPSGKMQKRNELVMVAQPKGTGAEAFRLLRTNLEFMRLSAGDVRTILVTSAVEREGKSTTSANLAVAEARSGRKVALVDLDLRRPYLDKFFRLSGQQGVTDVALGRVELREAVQRIDLQAGGPEAAGTTLPSLRAEPSAPVTQAGVLDVLVAGLLPPDPGEFAASYQLAEILARLRERYDVVVIDSPPLLRVGDALTLSSQVDGLIVVARLKGMRKPVLRELRRVLDVLPARKLGYVVTGPVPGSGGGYGYKSAYGYGGYYAPQDEETGGVKLGGRRGNDPSESGSRQRG